MNFKSIAIGAVSGLVAAVKTDMNAYKHAPEGELFDWGLAFKRWLMGAVTGALAGAGFGSFEF